MKTLLPPFPRLGTPFDQSVDEGLLPKWLNLVIWGHEHECKAEPEQKQESWG